MRKEYYNYVVKLPVLLHDLFREKVADYHFTDMTVVMNHLVKSYIRVTCGGKVSTATRRILLHMDRIPDMGFFFRRQEKVVLFLRWIRPSLTACNMPLPPVVGATASGLPFAWCALSVAVPT